jgi:hypothetical protein
MSNILIGTPAYGGMMHIDSVNSLLDYHRCKIPFSLMAIGNESLITRGRNTIISYFHSMKEFSHLFFLDADIGFSGESLIKLLSYEKDVIGVPVALKGFHPDGSPVYNTGKILEDCGNGLAKTDRVGTAIFMLSRKAVNDLIERAPQYSRNPYARGENKDITHYDVFQIGVVNGVYLSEDYWVCNELIKVGYDIHIANLPSKHNGNYQFGG